jgi:hypothetical protein
MYDWGTIGVAALELAAVGFFAVGLFYLVESWDKKHLKSLDNARRRQAREERQYRDLLRRG